MLDTCISCHTGDETICYKKVDENSIYLSIYYPKNFNYEKQYPTFFFIHGGGWTCHKVFEEQIKWSGDYLGYLARYYAKKGFVCVSIDYRLADPDGQKERYQIIDCYDDCVDAIDYILDRASLYGIDIQQVFLLGESAGGHLAGLLTVKYKREGFKFQSSFLINAILDFVDDERWKKKIPQKSEHRELCAISKNMYAQYLSPIYHINEHTCPVILIHGMKDCIVDSVHSEKFHERMKEFSKECELHMIEDTGHAFLLAEYTTNLTACQIGIEIIDKHIAVIKERGN